MLIDVVAKTGIDPMTFTFLVHAVATTPQVRIRQQGHRCEFKFYEGGRQCHRKDLACTKGEFVVTNPSCPELLNFVTGLNDL